jgi:MoaA/NifB/PqqE/SkfB family radical SAM enzyme
MKPLDWLTLTPVFLKCLGKLPLAHLWYLARQLSYENPQRHRNQLHINAFFPPYPSPAFERFLNAAIQRWRVPYSVYFAVTDKCPYHCPHCSYGRHDSGLLDTRHAMSIVEQVDRLGAVTMGFTGGEPLLRDDIASLVAAAADTMGTVLFTTGYRLTESVARALRKAHLDCITIGIESDRPDEHDAVRGVAGSYQTAMDAIAVSREAGLFTAISTMATRDKIQRGTLEALAELATRLGVQEFRILEPIPTGRFAGRGHEMLTEAETARIVNFHKSWNRRGRGPAIAAFSHLESAAMFGCGAGFHHLFIDAVGNVCPCDLTPLRFGNALAEPLDQIWARMGQWFDVPRCGCLVKQLYEQSTELRDAPVFPLCREESEAMCRRHVVATPLPTVFANLFKGHKPTNPPTTRPR